MEKFPTVGGPHNLQPARDRSALMANKLFRLSRKRIGFGFSLTDPYRSSVALGVEEPRCDLLIVSGKPIESIIIKINAKRQRDLHNKFNFSFKLIMLIDSADLSLATYNYIFSLNRI